MQGCSIGQVNPYFLLACLRSNFTQFEDLKGQVLKTNNYHYSQSPPLDSVCVSVWQLIHIPQEDAHFYLLRVISILKHCHRGVVGVINWDKME